MTARTLGKTLPREHKPDPLPGRRWGEGPRAGCPCGCALSRSTTHGFLVIDFARRLKVTLHPWQRWLLIHALELNAECSGYRFRTALVLVARQNGKTLVKMILTLWRLYMRNVRLAVGIAQDLSQAREVMNEGLVPMMTGNDKLRERFNPEFEPDPGLDKSERSALIWAERRGIWKKVTNDEYIRLDCRWVGGRPSTPYGPRYVIKALSRKAGRGLWDCAELNIDELREQTDFRSWSAVSKVVMAAPDSQIWAMSNAGDHTSVVLNHLRAIGLAGADPSMFIAEWSGEKGCDLDDPEEIAQANPSLGRMVTRNGVREVPLTWAAIESALRQDPANVFRTEVLCQFVDALDSAVDMIGWAACSDQSGELDFRRAAVVLESSTDGHVSAVAAAVTDDGRVRLALVDQWESVAEARRGLPGVEAFGPKALGWFPGGPGSTLSAAMRKRGAVPIKGAGEIEACMTFANAVKERQILQPDDETLNTHVTLTTRVGGKAAWRFEHGQVRTGAAWAAAGAVHLALNTPDPPKPGARKVITPSGTR